MRKSFFMKLAAILLFAFAAGAGWMIYVQPDEWPLIAGAFVLLVLGYLWSMWTTKRAAENEGGFAAELEDRKKR